MYVFIKVIAPFYGCFLDYCHVVVVSKHLQCVLNLSGYLGGLLAVSKRASAMHMMM